MSNISPETGPKFVIGRKLSPEEEAERIESLEDGRSDNSGGFARPSRVNPEVQLGIIANPHRLLKVQKWIEMLIQELTHSH